MQSLFGLTFTLFLLKTSVNRGFYWQCHLNILMILKDKVCTNLSSLRPHRRTKRWSEENWHSGGHHLTSNIASGVSQTKIMKNNKVAKLPLSQINSFAPFQDVSPLQVKLSGFSQSTIIHTSGKLLLCLIKS